MRVSLLSTQKTKPTYGGIHLLLQLIGGHGFSSNTEQAFCLQCFVETEGEYESIWHSRFGVPVSVDK